MDKAVFKGEATKWHDWFYSAQKSWSIAHHITVFGSIICSVGAGALLQIKSVDVGYATILTTVAAALSSIAAAGGFERKWRNNRLSRSRVDGLLIDIEGEAPNIQDLANQLKDIIAKHDQEIVEEASKEPSVRQKPKVDAANNHG